MAVNNLVWREEPWLKCMVSLVPSHMGEVTFVIFDKDGNEFEIIAPDYSFIANPVCNSNQILRAGNKIVRVGNTEIGYMSDRVNRIGRINLLFNGKLLTRIGDVRINYLSSKINQIGRTSIQHNGNRVARVGNTSLTYSGDSVCNIYGNVK